jgi:hypothetical protein
MQMLIIDEKGERQPTGVLPTTFAPPEFFPLRSAYHCSLGMEFSENLSQSDLARRSARSPYRRYKIAAGDKM